MDRKAHCKECLEKMGKEWECVHAWLDETAKDYFPWMGHRQIRHHEEGVEIIRERWGDEAAEAAEMHIISDMSYVPSEEQIRERYGRVPYNGIDKGEYPSFPRKKEESGVKPEDWKAPEGFE